MLAYDLHVLPRPAERGAVDNHGSCFGLPRGIVPVAWPLDRNTGYPLMHGFTLLLPEDHRVHGPDIVALSFFATAQNDGGTPEVPGIREALESRSPEPPADPDLLPFWWSGRAAHPRLSRMRDGLDCDYAAILLTREEFDGPSCPPPPLANSRLLQRTEAPAWLEVGSAVAFWDGTVSPHLDLRLEDYGIYKMLGGIPERGHAYHRALRWTPRANDPNAGVPPRDRWSDETSGYVDHFDPVTFEPLPWARDHAPNHIGGTMRPSQTIPEFSPHYVEFEESLGGYNFGGGNAQLDFRHMRFDWAQ